MKYIKPHKLKKGDKVGLVSPSNPIKDSVDKYEEAKRKFEDVLGIEIIPSRNAFNEFYYSAGTANERASDINDMFADPKIKAIWFSVGGNTAIDLVELLDYKLIKDNPKIVCGISDATTLLNAITAKTGLVTYLGMEFFDFIGRDMSYEFEYIRKTWFDGKIGEIKQNPNWKNFDGLPTHYKAWRTIKPGKAKGRLIGGNFTCFSQLMDSPYMAELKNNILIMETYKFHKKQIHRALMQLRINGVFNKISGFIIGYCLGSDNPDEKGNERDIKDILLETTEGYKFPIMEVGEIGHQVENIIVPIGAKAKINSAKLKFEIIEDVAID